MNDSGSIEHLEGIAIVGMSARFPGARSVDEFWRNLRDGAEAITFFSDEELELAGAEGSCEANRIKAGSVLADVESFDAAFFGMSPGEAEITDPQQRVFLECAWEALEDAGRDPETYKGSIGVFAGASISSYLLFNIYPTLGFKSAADDLTRLIGNDKDYLATRVSYQLNLKGPSVSVQTACSTSLVAVHLACQSLLNGECDMALAGGVTIRIPQKTGYLYQEGAYLSPDGHCRTFDAQARGTVFGSGAGVVVLKRLSEALADGDCIDAVIKGSAINNDGAVKVGYIAPSAEGQARVISEALAMAGISPRTITYVEAHGTGTPLGDPIEVSALTQVFRAATNARRFCALGSVKTNVGHLESAAGIAGLMKTVLALKHRRLPPSLHFERPNPQIDFEQSPFYVNTQLTAWDAGEAPLRAGVSSFGIGGTNAHVVLEEAPRSATAQPERDNSSQRAHLLPLSARSQPALQALADAYKEFLHTTDAPLRDICYTASARRAHHDHRLSVVGRSRQELIAQLEAASRQQEPLDGAPRGGARTGRPCKLVFVYSGQGPQWWAMGRRLLAEERAFRRAVEQCDELVRSYAGWSLMEELLGDESRSRVDADNIEITQVSLFAVQVGLTALWREWGVEPDAVVGHSMGEVAAGYASEALSLAEAVRVICARGRLLQRATQLGAMAAVELSLEEAGTALAGYEGRVGVGASNGPRSTVLSGEVEAVEAVLRQLEEREVFVRRLRTTGVAGHSPQVEPLCVELENELAALRPQRGKARMVSTVSGAAIAGPELNAGYWRRNLREPVLFAKAMRTLMADDYAMYVEVSAHPVLAAAMEECLREEAKESRVAGSLRREADERTEMLRTLGALYRSGYAVAWEKVYREGGRCLRLPGYPWQRSRFWIEAPRKAKGKAHEQYAPRHDETSARSLPGRHFTSSLHAGTHFWENELSVERFPYLSDHVVRGRVVLPAAAYIEAALRTASEIFGQGPHTLEKLSLQKALLLGDESERVVQIVIAPEKSGTASFHFSSRPAQGKVTRSEWLLHASGTLHLGRKDESVAAPEHSSLADIKARCGEALTGPEHYHAMEARGVQYGARFRGVEFLLRNESEALAGLSLPRGLEPVAEADRLHPGLLDSCFQTLASLLPAGDAAHAASTYVPVWLDELRLYEQPSERAWAHAMLRPQTDADTNVLTGDVFMLDEDGRVSLEARGLRVRRLEPAVPRQEQNDLNRMLYGVEWEPVPRPARKSEGAAWPPQGREGAWLIFADSGGIGEELRRQLEGRGEKCVTVVCGEEYEVATHAQYRINPARQEHFRRLLADACGDLQSSCRGMVHLWSFDAAPPEAITRDSLDAAHTLGCGSALHLVQALAQTGWRDAPRLWIVTGGVQSIGNRSEPVSVTQSPVWGLGKVINYEHAELRCTLVDLSSTNPRAELQSLIEEFYARDDEREVALRGHARFGARLSRSLPAFDLPEEPESFEMPESFDASPLLDPDATYLITGGLGGLGLSAAGWMIECGARHLVLLGRNGPTPASSQAVDAMRQGGASIVIARADVARREQVARVLAEASRAMPPLRGVIHAAGVLADSTLLQLNEERLKAVLSPKVQGAWNLYTLTLNLPLDFFVLFSSVASVLGSPGQSNHSAANTFLDALARHVQSQGGVCLSINWGPWGEVGQVTQADRAETLALRGMTSISSRQALEIMERLLRRKVAQAVVMRFEPGKWCRFYPHTAGAKFFSRLAQEREEPVRRGAEERAIKEAMLAVRSGRRRRALLESHLQKQVARVLRLASPDIAPDKPLRELGLDSLRALELRNLLEAGLRLVLPATLVWKYPTIGELAAHLATLMAVPLDEPAESRAASWMVVGGPMRDSPKLTELSEEEAEALLSQKLAAITERR
jgi:myxalamid-type polyketide synthase MxaE and MxaD/epothilone polyketide synthase C/epothilone polyketide synthase D